MRALLLPLCIAAFMLMADVHPVYAQEDKREGRGRGRSDSGEYERREGDHWTDRRDREERRRGSRGVLEDILGPRNAEVPKGHYPPPGECRMWYPSRPPGQQPPPVSCHRLQGRRLGGGFILYGDRAYDANYEWEEYERRRPNSIPEVILDIILSRRR